MSRPPPMPEVEAASSTSVFPVTSEGLLTTDLADGLAVPRDSWVPAQEIGRYLIIGELGAGGIGRVLRAYDPKLQREVALKILQVARMSSLAQQRLVREARAMARLSHPNVVGVYDVDLDTEHGVVIAMEFVEGITLRQWLREGDRPWSEVVARFIEAGRGLAAAHAVDLMHRDFKPSNVLVGRDGRVRVTDFGLARATGTAEDAGVAAGRGGRESSDSLAIELTEAGTIMGTPRYMSPEHHDGEPLDATTDQYAFCVALWAGLTGFPPFAGSYAELEAAKRRGPPPWPGVPGVPRRVADALRRGLASDRSRRWPDMDALLEAIEPRPIRWRSVLVAGGLVAGVGALAWAGGAPPEPCQGARAQLEGHWDPAVKARAEAGLAKTGLVYAPRVWDRVEQALDDYADRWVQEHRDACEATAVRREQSSEMLDRRMVCLDRARVALRVTADVLATADDATVRAAHEIVDHLPPLQRCADVAALGEQVTPPSPADETAVAAVRERLTRARALTDVGRHDEASKELSEIDRQLRDIEYAPLTTEVELVRGTLRRGEARYDEAEGAFKAAMRSGMAHDQWPEAFSAASALVELVGSRMARPAEGLAYAETAWALLGRSSADGGDEAGLRHGLAAVASVRGELAEAEAHDRAALELLLRRHGPRGLPVAVARINLAAVVESRGRYAEAEQLFHEAREVLVSELGPDHPNVTRARHNLANLLSAQGRYAEAEVEQRAVLQGWEQTLGLDHPNVAMIRANLAATLRALGRLTDAETEHREALRVFEAVFGPRHPNVGLARNNLGNILSDQGRHEAAQQEYRRALSIVEEALGVDHLSAVQMQLNLATLLMKQGEGQDEARQLADRAWAGLDPEEIPPDLHGLALFTRARVLRAEQPERARMLALEARSKYVQGSPDGSAELDDLDEWLAREGWDVPPREPQ